MKNKSFYIVAAVIIIAMLATVTLTVTHSMFESFWRQPLCKIIFNHLADAILLLAPCCVLKWRRTWALVITWIVALWCFLQLLYYPTYRDVMPFSSFLLVKNISTTLVKSALGAVTKKSLAVLLMPLLLHAYHWWIRHDDEPSKPKRNWWAFVGCIVGFVVLRAVITCSIYLANSENYSGLRDAFATHYSKFGGRHLNYVMHNGVMSYALYSLATSVDWGVSDDEQREADDFVKKNCLSYNDNPHVTTIAEHPNLIFIMVESLNAWVVNLDINGKPVTPTLNALAADTTHNIVCLNVISQAKNGHSSDGKFMYQTGLLPMLDKSVAMEYSDRNFPSLVKALKEHDYKAIEICGDEASLWNVEGMSVAYDFDTLYHQPELKEQLEACDYRIDKVVMEYAANYLPKVKGPFIAQIFTGTMHSPYNDDWEPLTWISDSTLYTPAVHNYLEKTHYFDQQLSAFLERLKETRLYNNSVIVIASDHSEPVDDDPQGRPLLSRDANECVLLIINPRSGKKVKGPVGQIDVYPTLLDVMGLNSYKWKGLGHSLLRNEVCSAAVSTDESVGTSPLLPAQQQAWTVSDILIRANKIPGAQ